MVVPNFAFGWNVPFGYKTCGRTRQANGGRDIEQLWVFFFDDRRATTLALARATEALGHPSAA